MSLEWDSRPVPSRQPFTIFSAAIPPYESSRRSSPFTKQSTAPSFVPYASSLRLSPTDEDRATDATLRYPLDRDSQGPTGYPAKRKRRRISQGELPRDEASRVFLCPEPGCGKKFARPSAVATHNRSHTLEKRT